MKGQWLKILLLINCCVAGWQGLYSQNIFKAVVTDSITHEKLNGAAVALQKTGTGAITDTAGFVEIKNVPNGEMVFEASYPGYEKKIFALHFPLAGNELYKIEMAQQGQSTGDIIVTSNRTNSRIEETPIKVEVLGADDLNEESSLKPGNISSLLSDVSGIQIQQTSAVSGNSVIKMLGMDGRYTMLLRDGLPAYIGLSGGLNILQIPPLDMKQIEIVKGPSSTINGAGAIAGLINFVTKTPADSNEAAFVFNQSSLLETNFDAYLSGQKNKMGYTLFAGVTHQFAVDVNHDGFSDDPQLLSLLIHPQLFFYPDTKTQVRVGVLVNYENRLGGDMDVIRGLSDSTHQYFERNITQNYGADLILNHQFSNGNELCFKSNGNYFNRDFNTNTSEFAGVQWSAYSELYYSVKRSNDNFIAGADYLFDRFQPSTGDTSGFPEQTYHTIGVFAQNNYIVGKLLNFQLGLRLDWQNAYGFFALPEAAILVHANKDFSVRVHGGSGYLTPDLLDIAEMNETMTSRIATSNTLLSEDEYSLGGTAEWIYSKVFPDKNMALYVNQTFFYTWVRNAIIEQYFANGTDSVYNTKTASSLGVDNYIRITKDPIEAYIGYTFTYPRKNADKEQPYLTLTPLHRLAAVITANAGKYFRFGLEGSLYGKQYLDDGAQTKPYFLLSASVQYHIKKITLVLNGENILNVRQSHFAPVVRPPYTTPVFSQIWEPEDGAVVNFSVMVRI